MRLTCSALALVIGCAATEPSPVTIDPDELGDTMGKADGASLVPDVACAGEPDAGPRGKFRHLTSRITSALGNPKHRGFDLITTSSATTQTLAGALSYTIADKALEDEDVDVFVCRAGAWDKAGRTRTDGEGRFALKLGGGDRLAVGLRDLFVSVVGDRTGARFVGYVAPDGAALLAVDIDGTLTDSENAFLSQIVTGTDAAIQPSSPEALAVARARGYQLVYVTSRGQQYTEATRGWLARKGYPRGPLRLSPSFVTLPGGDTVDYKTEALTAIEASGLELAAGIGNRATDIAAYANVGVPADRIFVETTEFASEVQPEVAAGHATGFASYPDLMPVLAQLPPR